MKPIDIPGYETLYKIDKTGQVYSIKSKYRTIIMSPTLNKKGYLYLGLYKNNKRKWFCVHRLVGMTYLNLTQELCINHINGIKTNNNLSNLEICTYKQNTEHAIKYGLKNDIGINNFRYKGVRKCKN